MAAPDDKVRGESKETGDMKTKKPKPLTLDELVKIIDASPLNTLATGSGVHVVEGARATSMRIYAMLDADALVKKLNERMGLT